MVKKILVLIASVFILSACAPTTVSYSAPKENSLSHAQTTPSEISSADPTATETPTLMAATATETETPEPTLTPQPLEIDFLSASANYQTSSAFTLFINNPGGKFYATASQAGSDIVDYQCGFDANEQNHLVCNGSAVPLNASMYVQLFDSSTGKAVYNNMISFAGIVPTPTGMSCEVEPQWNGFIPAHQLEYGCYAMTCVQNGQFFYGTDNTCETSWPFDWNFIPPVVTNK
jgi:hypothetical protein